MASSRGKKSTSTVRKKTGNGSTTGKRTKSSKRTSKSRERLTQEERRAMEVRRDIRLLLLFGAMAFLMISELGYGGAVGKALSSAMFGLFGTPAYAVPPFVFFMVLFIISNRGKRTLPVRTVSLVMLLVSACTGFALWGGEIRQATAYNAQEIYQRCAAAREGGGLIGETAAYWLYQAFRNVGSVFVLILVVMICVLAITQFSPLAVYRRAEEQRILSGEPTFMERRRLRAEQARIASEMRREAAAEARKKREELLEQDRQNQEDRRRKAAETAFAYADGDKDYAGKKAAENRSAAADLLNTKIKPAEEAEEEDFGLDEGSFLFRKKDKKETAKEASPQSDPVPEKIRNDSVHGIRVIERETDEQAELKEIRVSASPVTARKADPSERILRPDANTVRVASEEMQRVGPDTGRSDPKSPGRATMTVFTTTRDTGRLSEELRFPFEQEDEDRKMRKVFVGDGTFGEGSEGLQTDLADAGGMSTFNVMNTFRNEKTPGPEEIPWGADALTEEEILAIEAAEAGFANQKPAAGSAPKQTRKQSSSGNTAPAVQAAAKTGTLSEQESVQRVTAKAIAEENLEGIEVHRDRGEEKGKTAGRTVMSGQSRNKENRKYSFPPFSLMEKGRTANSAETDKELKETAFRLQETLRTFGVNVTITDISQGPSVTRYELQPEQGVKVSKIVNLANDIKLSLAAVDIRIEAPIPGKPAIGIEVPNRHRSVVALRDILETNAFRGAKSKLAFGAGKDLGGKTVVTDIAKMPHLLIAGATGSGKSVCINTIIISLLYKASPDEVQLIMIDPKVVELSVYNGIPHLMIPVVTDVRKASAALNWAVTEMDRRYKLFAAAGARDLNGYNSMIRAKGSSAGENEKILPRLVVIVDELADLMMVAKNDVESAICRLAQLARAAGIHLIIATQRPSVDVITGLIKANMPSRIAFAVTSQVDSRTILDMAGAEKLIGKGDMLFYPQSYQKPARIQGAFISDEDVMNVVNYIKANNAFYGDEAGTIDTMIDNMAANGGNSPDPEIGGGTNLDEHFAEAGRFIIEKNKASIGMLQRVFKIGFNRAARIMDQLAEAGVVSEDNGTKARQVLMDMASFEQLLEEM